VIRYRIRITHAALEQMDRAAAWWREHRDKAPDAFDDDTDEAIRVLQDNPFIGQTVSLSKPTRRFWLDRIRFYIYYRVEDDIIVILAVWHGSRGSHPPI
jgi:Plasmid stabilization system protein